MTDKLITHEEARKENNLMMENHITLTKEKYQFRAEEMANRRTTNYKKNDDYIKQNEQRDRDITRSFELENKYLLDTQTTEEMHERWALEDKLSKVGKEE